MKTSLFVLAILGALSFSAKAAPNDGITGAYARVEVGRSRFGPSHSPLRLGSDDQGQAAKIFGGYRFDTGLGVELGYAMLGQFSETLAQGNSSVRQEHKAHSVFAAATGRWPVGDAFALHGRLGLSSGRVTGNDVLPQGEPLGGAKTSPLIGLGVEYRPRSNIALTLNYDHYGKVSSQVSASALLFGLHFTL